MLRLSTGSRYRGLSLALLALISALAGMGGCGRTRTWESTGIDSPVASGIQGGRKCAIETVVSTEDIGAMATFQIKDVDIWIKDDDGDVLLHDELVYSAGGIDPEYSWKRWDEVSVHLVERGYAESKHAYARELARIGDRPLVTLTYRFDRQKDEFVRVGALPGMGAQETTRAPLNE